MIRIIGTALQWEKDRLTQPEPDSKMQKRKRHLRDIKCRDGGSKQAALWPL